MNTTLPLAPQDRKPYAAPTLDALGAVGRVTAGPEGGDLDQLIGSSGGFQAVDPS